MSSNRNELWESLEKSIHRSPELALILSMLLEQVRVLPWDKLPQENWATVYHNFAHWSFASKRFAIEDYAVNPSYPSALRSALTAFPKYALCSVTLLKEVLQESGDPDWEKAEAVTDECLETFKWARSVTQFMF